MTDAKPDAVNGKRPQPAAASASTLILLQISARALTFVLNQLLVRLVAPGIFGLANIQLELLLSTILFLSRDAIRTILIRNDRTRHASSVAASGAGPRSGTTNATHNVALLTIPIGFALTAIACGAYTAFISPKSIHAVPTFHASIALYALGALSELVYEPLLIRAVRLGQPSLRVKAEGAAVFVKVLTTIVTILCLPRWLTAPSTIKHVLADEKAVALLAFGIGQASFGMTMLAVHLSYFVTSYSVRQTLDLYIPRPDRVTRSDPRTGVASTETAWLDRATVSLCMAMAQQGVLKHLLTEADKFAVARYATLEDQGGYALASNYGSLVARILFQPVEETARILFSSELVALDDESGASRPAPTGILRKAVEKAASMLAALFRLHLLLACIMITFGGPLSTAFLYIMAGPQWALGTSAPAILAAYTWYLPIMGINGIAEGFVQSVASRKQVKSYNRILLIASVGFVTVLASINYAVASRPTGNLGQAPGTSSFLAKTGLVWANAISLSVRAGWCWAFLIKYFGLAESVTGQESKHDSTGSQAAIQHRVRPSAALPSRPATVVFASVAGVLRVLVPKLMPTAAELLQSSNANEEASRAGRLQAIRLLLPTVGLAGACLGAVLTSIFVFERAALLESLRSLGRRDASQSHADTRKSQ